MSRRSSATRSCTGRCRADKRRPARAARRLRPDQGAARTTGRHFGLCLTSYQRPGRRCSTPAVPPGGSLVVLGLGPVGGIGCPDRPPTRRCSRRWSRSGAERLQRAQLEGIDTIDLRTSDDIVQEIRDRFDGRGPDAVIDAVGMEHGSPGMKTVQAMAGMTPDTVGEFLLERGR